MGWFSFLRKDKQTSGEAEGAYVARSEESDARNRSKRAAAKAPNEPVDPVLPEKKRARRRLVGAIALALAVIIGLPMVLDSEPKPLAGDIAIQIPSKDKPYSANDAASRPRTSVPAEQALDQGEELVDLPKQASAKPSASAQSTTLPAATTVATAATPTKAAEPKAPETRAAETKAVEAKAAEAKVAEAKAAEIKAAEIKAAEAKATKAAEAKARAAELKAAETKAETKTGKPDTKPTERKPADQSESKPVARAEQDAERARAMLEGKAEAKPIKYVVQIAALSSQEKIDELQGKLREAGINAHTQKVATDSGTRTRIRVGPFADKEEATRMREKLIKLGLSGTLIPQ